ncbi:hypothetical protein GPALN_005411 [Globodera pallida]|uniref:Transmembrane protein n=1 Tax=Globodera pallida TaxID=36090 RepID=A0A183BQ56_GLOPA|nr:hypothetical protein GPALN_005411 [Globodera pallida]
MMFINPRPVDLECCEEMEKGKHRVNSQIRRSIARGRGGDASSGYLQRVTFIILAIYLFLSACLALFSYPLSITSVIVPLLVVTITICAAMNSRTEETLWLCAIASAIGAFGKMVAIIAFSSIFGFTRGLGTVEGRRREVVKPPQSAEDAMRSDRWLTHFFVVLLMGEALLMLLIACIRCNLNFLKKCFRLDPY